MKDFKIYNIYLLLVLLALSISLLGLSFFMRPIEGNLTRLGGFLSNDFSINENRFEFKKPLYKLAKKLSDYDRYYEIVIIGDSFSRNLKSGWQNFLSNKTGASIITFDIQKTSVSEILQTPMFKKRPPRIFIYESVEYAIWLRNSYCSTELGDNYVKAVSQKQALLISSLGVSPLTVPPSLPSFKTMKFDVDAAANYLYKSFFRNILSLNFTDVRYYELTNPSLFSNNSSDIILFHYKNFDKLDISKKNIETSVCSLLNLQRAVENNKETSFLFLPIPDKLSAYASKLTTDEFINIGIIKDFENINLNMVRVDDYISREIENGVVDLYLPDDTHFSYKGYKVASLAVFDYLLTAGLISERAGQ